MKMWMVTMALGGMITTSAVAQKAYPNSENFGVPFDQQSDWYRQCIQVKHRQPPAPAVPVAPGVRCQPGAYYLKLDQAATSQSEWDLVRSCAAAAKDSAVLSMLYANGFGVERDTALATKYACSTGAALAEMEGRVKHLANLQQGSRYDQCDDITSGVMGAVCADIAAGRADRIRKGFFARLRRSLPPSQQAPFDALVIANEAFAQARAGNEVEMAGTAAPGFAIEAEAREKEWLREHLAAFEKGRFDLATAAPFDDDDAQLNQAYSQALESLTRKKETPGLRLGGEVEAPGVRVTQRAWLEYRDAWSVFAALRYRGLPRDVLMASLTEWRLKELKRL